MTARVRTPRVAVAAIAVVGGVALSLPSPAAATRLCGLTPRIDGVRYDVHEVKGTLSCRTVRKAATSFISSGKSPSGWTCFRGHGSSPYAASCAKGTKVLVRVYAPN